MVSYKFYVMLTIYGRYFHLNTRGMFGKYIIDTTLVRVNIKVQFHVRRVTIEIISKFQISCTKYRQKYCFHVNNTTEFVMSDCFEVEKDSSINNCFIN